MRSNRGFTLVEVMMVMVIIGVLIAMAIPVYTATRQTSEKRTCFANERAIEGQYQSLRAEQGEDIASAISNWGELMAAMVPSHFAREPFCPSGGVYSWDSARKQVDCDFHGHYPEP